MCQLPDRHCVKVKDEGNKLGNVFAATDELVIIQNDFAATR